MSAFALHDELPLGVDRVIDGSKLGRGATFAGSDGPEFNGPVIEAFQGQRRSGDRVKFVDGVKNGSR